ncbi:hypothetical protein CTheo_6848 [Ceratobasidium theobromae]|uniref:Uncharacterized protein n=1 Tax=Ceratobasidium theobromae TaxID=1582974 RepID=A0A5N5QE22_9AGAM|nr:hypothetical protein CTheo_6848 [Ceratobasidium theobromae]
MPTDINNSLLSEMVARTEKQKNDMERIEAQTELLRETIRQLESSMNRNTNVLLTRDTERSRVLTNLEGSVEEVNQRLVGVEGTLAAIQEQLQILVRVIAPAAHIPVTPAPVVPGSTYNNSLPPSPGHPQQPEIAPPTDPAECARAAPADSTIDSDDSGSITFRHDYRLSIDTWETTFAGPRLR